MAGSLAGWLAGWLNDWLGEGLAKAQWSKARLSQAALKLSEAERN